MYLRTRQRLLRNGFLRRVMNGWLLSSSPESRDGDSTPWYASFWEFCARYCEQRFGDAWHLSPDRSLLLYAENSVIPPQVIVHAARGTNNLVPLLFGTSLYDLKESKTPVAVDLTVRDGLRLFPPPPPWPGLPKVFTRAIRSRPKSPSTASRIPQTFCDASSRRAGPPWRDGWWGPSATLAGQISGTKSRRP
jgi:hypothetical protein